MRHRNLRPFERLKLSHWFRANLSRAEVPLNKSPICDCAIGFSCLLTVLHMFVGGLQRPPSDLNFDAQLLVERVDVLVWYLHHEQVALAHLIMALLEGPHNEGQYYLV